MRTTPIAQYTQAHQFEPLLPQKKLDALRERAASLIGASNALKQTLRPQPQALVHSLVREMNAHYSNAIEGEAASPGEIRDALRDDYSNDTNTARRQRLAVAHIAAEFALERRVAPSASALSAAVVQHAHESIYMRLPPEERRTTEGHCFVPGCLRDVRVLIGEHEPPPPEALATFLARFDQVYKKAPTAEDAIIYAAAAHQRMCWIHPFADGNGRACRMQTQFALDRLTSGLWSLSRGLARHQKAYFSRLAAADEGRRSDLDGRGNLSEAALSDWCNWFIDICEEEVACMARHFERTALGPRLEALVAARLAQSQSMTPEAAAVLLHLLIDGPVSRGSVQQLTGRDEQGASALLSCLALTGLISRSDNLDHAYMAIPVDALDVLLPGLYPAAPTSTCCGQP
ncbi:Fic family protein [Niveibacterium sp. 24ML]|uniref:Fic family protein n=1 Tax=Niveibacterium sp. 24ML TaxID=2985512 RepID=UPI00226F4B9D|nr:Fic family protein [Niveibacterium sp. 24ML]MCX9158035.1 Fic family protein [Niveibacterium sp. 24ML]